jgi:hypothetical protein
MLDGHAVSEDPKVIWIFFWQRQVLKLTRYKKVYGAWVKKKIPLFTIATKGDKTWKSAPSTRR